MDVICCLHSHGRGVRFQGLCFGMVRFKWGRKGWYERCVRREVEYAILLSTTLTHPMEA